MAKVVDEDGLVNIGRPITTSQDPDLFVGDWKRTFVIAPKRSIADAAIRPLSTVYARQREVFEKGQRLVLTEYLSQTEYLMAILKDEGM